MRMRYQKSQAAGARCESEHTEPEQESLTTFDVILETSMSGKSTGNRRQFLLGASAASVAAVAVLAAKAKPAPALKSPKAGVPAGRGYELTEHVRNYYRTTAV